MKIPRDINGSVDLQALEFLLGNSLAVNPQEPIEIIDTDEVEESQIREYLDPDTFNIESEKVDDGYKLTISVKT